MDKKRKAVALRGMIISGTLLLITAVYWLLAY